MALKFTKYKKHKQKTRKDYKKTKKKIVYGGGQKSARQKTGKVAGKVAHYEQQSVQQQSPPKQSPPPKKVFSSVVTALKSLLALRTSKQVTSTPTPTPPKVQPTPPQVPNNAAKEQIEQMLHNPGQ